MRYKVLLTLVAVMLLLPFSLKADTPIDGITFGTIVGQGIHPEFGYAVTKSFSLEPIGGGIFKSIEVSGLYSDQNWVASEMYVARAFTGRQIAWRQVYADLGVGTWVMFNTEGGDQAKTAFKLALGFWYGPADLRFSGEIVSFDGPDRYFLSAGLVILNL